MQKKKQNRVKAEEPISYKTYWFVVIDKDAYISYKEPNFIFIVKADNRTIANEIAQHKFANDKQEVFIIDYAGELIQGDGVYRVNLKPEY